MNRGQNRATLFADDADFGYFVSLLARYSGRFQVRLYHYCLLNNHFHLLLQLPQPRHLSRLVAGLLVAYVRYVQRRYRFVGHLFQGRFKKMELGAWGQFSKHLDVTEVAIKMVRVPEAPFSGGSDAAVTTPNLVERGCLLPCHEPGPEPRYALCR
jgi:putative transposase